MVINTCHFQVNDLFYEFKYHPSQVGNHSSTLTFNNSIENQILKQYWYPYVRSGDVVVDCGASFGLYTLPALTMGAQVHAFEPHPELFESLVKNVRLNYFDCHMYRYGLDMFTGVVEYNDADLSSYKQPTNATIEVIKLDDLNINPNLVKIDVEGAELFVLQGALETLKRSKPKLLVETHNMYQEDIVERILTWLKNYFDMNVDNANFQRSYIFITFK